MTVPGSAHALLLAGAVDEGGYAIQRSLRFNSSDSAYLSRTPSSNGTSYTTWTWSQWVKRSTLGVGQVLFSAGVNTQDYLIFNFESNNTLRLVTGENGATNQNLFTTPAVFRDPSAWYHIVLQSDTTNATQADRWKIYINGVRQTVSGTIAAQNYAGTTFNRSGVAHNIGRQGNGVAYFSGYLADIHFIDGQALDPTSFGEFDATTGVWVPKAYTGTYGTNGFRLDFADNSSNTATTLGKDTSPNGNNWTPVNLSATTGGPTSVAAASGALPIYNTTDTYGATKGTGTRTDSNSSSIVLALPMDGTNNGTTFTDESATIKGSGSAKTISRNGNPVTSTSQAKYYGSSGYFDGSSYLTVGASSDFALGTGDFAIEAWCYLTSASNFKTIVTTRGQGGMNLWLGFTNGGTTPVLYAGGGSLVTSSTATGTGRWAHIAAVRNGGTTYLYLDGIQVGSAADSNNYADQTCYVGYDPATGNYPLPGYIQDLRIYKGVAKYTSNFNPPSSTANATIAAGNDSLVDVPTNGAQTDTGAGGEVRGNYCTWNAVDKSSNVTLSNGNLDTLHGGAGHTKAVGNIYVSSGKWYAEFTLATQGGAFPVVGINSITLQSRDTYVGSETGSFGYSVSALKYSGSAPAGTAYGATFTAGDVIGVALDLDTGTLVFYKNGASQGTAFTGVSGTYTFAVSGIGSSASWVANFGQRPFAYTAPSGFKALCTANLPAPLVTKPNTVMDVALYTGNNTARSITGLGFSPDFVWIKGRSGSTDHALYDIVRGVQLDLVSNSTAAETTQTTGLTAFNSDGFSIGTLAKLNTNAATYAAWAWDAGSSTVTNTQGSISSQVRANASAGFSVVTANITNVSGSIGHGLGVVPALIIGKNRQNLGTSWIVYHSALGANDYLVLNSTAAKATSSIIWNGTTSTTFTQGGGWTGSSFNHVFYCFAPVAGYSAFGSYTGNGSADGPFVYTGFRPRWILYKRSDSGTGSGNWNLVDTSRSTYNVSQTEVIANDSIAEFTSSNANMDILSNGFKIRTTDASRNESAKTFIYAAFAESPFQYARAR